MKAKGINIHFIFILLAASLWGMAGIFVRTAEKLKISEMQLVFGRAVFTAVIIGLIILIFDRSAFKIKLKDLWLFLCAGLFSIVLFNFSYYNTMRLSSLSVAAVLLYTAPFFVVFISRILYGKRITKTKCIACMTAFIGCLFVSGFFSTSQRICLNALIFGLLTGLGYALYTVFSEILLNRGYKTLTITFYVFLFAGLFCYPFINVVKTVGFAASDLRALGIVVLMALFNTVIPYLLYTKGLTGVDPTAAPIIATVEPVVATLVGAIFFKEAITLFGAIGIALVLLSVIVLNRRTVVATANAKINLILSITGKREDGYHLIDTVMQSVNLYDKVKISQSKSIEVECSLCELANEQNIAFSAAKLFFKETGIEGGAKIYIKKRIPTAAGLGGGSADAAAVLMGLDKLYKTELSKEKLKEMALSLGADIPFFIEGGTVRAEGIGERLSRLKAFKRGYFLLVKEDKKPSTGEMYKRLDSEKPKLPDVEQFIEALKNGVLDKAAALMDNSFRAVWPDNKTEKRLLELDPTSVSLSGSGPTSIAYYKDYSKAKAALRCLKKEKIEAYLVRPVERAIILE